MTKRVFRNHPSVPKLTGCSNRYTPSLARWYRDIMSIRTTITLPARTDLQRLFPRTSMNDRLQCLRDIQTQLEQTVSQCPREYTLDCRSNSVAAIKPSGLVKSCRLFNSQSNPNAASSHSTKRFQTRPAPQNHSPASKTCTRIVVVAEAVVVVVVVVVVVRSVVV